MLIIPRITKLGISLFYFGVLQTSRFVSRLFGKASSPIGVVLYYHSVPSSARSKFERQMDIVCRLTDPLSDHTPSKPIRNAYLSLVTFDDAFENVIQNALPGLMQRHIPSIIFVTVGVLGRTADWWPAGSREEHLPICTAEQIATLPTTVVEVGAHTMTHPRLSRLSDEQAWIELSQSRQTLEHLLGREVTSFSFPYGDLDDRIVDLCRKAGFKSLYTTRHEDALTPATPGLIGRVKVEPTDWAIEFYLKLLGGYFWLPRAIVLKRTVRNFFGNSGMRRPQPLPKRA